MFPLLTGLMTGGMGLLGSMFSSNQNASNVQATNQANQAMLSQQEQYNTGATQESQQFASGQVQQQENFQEQMSNTAYQRASADMKKAGLNPASMFGGGSAASSPSGSSASVGPMGVSTPRMDYSGRTSPMAGLADAASKAMSSAITAKTMDKMTDEISNLQTQRALTTAETDVAKERVGLTSAETAQTVAAKARTQAETDTERERRLNIATDTSSRALRMPEARLGGASAEAIMSMPEWMRDSAIRGSFFGQKAGDLVSPFLSSARAYRTFNDRWP